MNEQSKEFKSGHLPGMPGFSHGNGATIVWGEDGSGARPEEILQMVLERVEYLQSVLPCEENTEILNHLRSTLVWEQIRTRRRKEQGVSGSEKAHQSVDNWKEADGVVSEGPPHAEPPHAEHSPDEPPPEEVHDDENLQGEVQIQFEDASEQVSEPPPEHVPPESPQPDHLPPNPDLEMEDHPHPLDIAMPVQDGRFISQLVLASLDAQCIPYRLWVSTVYSNGEFANARNSVREAALRGTSPYILMTDNDLVFSDGDFRAMVLWLENNPDFGAIAISKHSAPDAQNGEAVIEPPHVDAGPVMFRREVFQQFAYSNKGGTCECAAMCRTLREEMNQRIGFLTGRSVRHIRNTRLD